MERIAELEKEVAKTEEKVKNLEKDLEEKDDEIETLEKKVSGLEDQLEEQGDYKEQRDRILDELGVRESDWELMQGHFRPLHLLAKLGVE